MARRVLFLSVTIVCLSLLLAPFRWSLLYGGSDLSVTRDDDKTVYSIRSDGAARREEQKEKEKAWDMLKHMQIRPVPPQNGRQPAQPPASNTQNNNL